MNLKILQLSRAITELLNPLRPIKCEQWRTCGLYQNNKNSQCQCDGSHIRKPYCGRHREKLVSKNQQWW